MGSDAYDFPLPESVVILGFNLHFPRGTWSRNLVYTVAECYQHIGSLRQYTRVNFFEMFRWGAMRMTTHYQNLIKFFSLTCIFLGALGREV